LGEGLQVLIYCKDQTDLFARICGYFDSHNLSILDARINTSKTGYALDSFLVADATQQAYYRELIALLENELTQNLQEMRDLPPPVKGRPSRQSKHFPILPSVQLKADERNLYHVLHLTAVDRTGLLYGVASELARHRVVIHSAKILTLGERVEDTFLIAGPMLNSPRQQIQLETDLMKALAG
jgi:[protein-PII] uridylyltransferase